jgi:hypothetical protein
MASRWIFHQRLVIIHHSNTSLTVAITLSIRLRSTTSSATRHQSSLLQSILIRYLRSNGLTDSGRRIHRLDGLLLCTSRSLSSGVNTSALPTIALTLAAAEDSVHSRMRNYKRLKTTHRDNGIADELTEYLTSDPLTDPQYTTDGVFNPYVPPFDTLQWWFERRRQWPNLSRMAFDCLSVPLMGDNPERSFSAGRDMITYRRSQLGSDIIEACAFIRSVYGPPVIVRAGTTTTTPAFDDEVEVEKDMKQQRQQQQSFQQSVVSTTVDLQSQSEDLYG